MLATLRHLASRLTSSSVAAPWSNVYGLARSSLAFGTLLTLLAHDTDTLFRPTGESLAVITDQIPVTGASLFFLLPSLEMGRWVAIAGLLLVLSGWRPRFTGLLHWWIAWSFSVSCVLIDGGDQITAVLTALLVPVTLTDPRRWHWREAPAVERLGSKIAALVGGSALVVARIQVAAIYFHAGVGKLAVEDWTNGTAVYYWFLHPVFGVPDWLEPLMVPLLTHAAGVTLFTWGVIAFEVLLAMALVIDRRWWPPLLAVALVFHLGIAVVHGLVSFFFAMAGGLILFLRAKDDPFEWPSGLLGEGVRRWLRRPRSAPARRAQEAPEPSAAPTPAREGVL